MIIPSIISLSSLLVPKGRLNALPDSTIKILNELVFNIVYITQSDLETKSIRSLHGIQMPSLLLHQIVM